MNPILFYLVDIDGTIADLTHRLHFISKDLGKPNWDAFFEACDGDAPIQQVIDTINELSKAQCRLIFITGRSEAIREKTLNWMLRHDVRPDEMYMRKAGDHREDNVVKSELLDKFLTDYEMTEQSITAAFEDRDQVVKMYRARGIRVFQVAEGNF